MKSITTTAKLLFISFLLCFSQVSLGQNCTWLGEVFDSFEYSTVCPDLIPGKTVHNVPQSFAVHSGNQSLYLNFINCVGTTGTCAGDKVYERKLYACPFQKYRFSAWLTTSFSGLQCNVRIKITDKQGNVLDDQLQIVAPYAPVWGQYQSAVVVPQSDTLIFTMYTNVGGGNGNDLSFDDFLFEKCLQPYTSSTAEELCSDGALVNLFDSTPYSQSTAGTWSGPSSLAGGHLGVFDPQLNTPGFYLYTHYPFTNSCPIAYDSVSVLVSQTPQPELGNDTTLCTNQTLILNPGTGAGYSYLWNNGVTGPQTLAFAPGGLPVTSTYSVSVTDTASGCASSDSVTVAFITCSGLAETNGGSLQISPNPASETVLLQFDCGGKVFQLEIFNTNGQLVYRMPISGKTHALPVDKLESGVFHLVILDNNNRSSAHGNLIVTDN